MENQDLHQCPYRIREEVRALPGTWLQAGLGGWGLRGSTRAWVGWSAFVCGALGPAGFEILSATSSYRNVCPATEAIEGRTGGHARIEEERNEMAFLPACARAETPQDV